MKRAAQNLKLFALLGLMLVAVRPVYGSWTSAVSADNPTVWYQFEETSGTSAADSGSAGETAIYEGGVTLNQTGIVGRAVLFDGSNDRVHATTVPVGASFTIEALAKSVGATWNTYDGLGAARNGNVNNGFLFGGVSGSTSVEAYVGSNTSINNNAGSFDASPIDTSFQHYVLTYDATTGVAKMYLDGTLKKTTNFNFGVNQRIADTLTNLYVGADFDASRFSNILVDDWLLYNTALNQSQVTAHFNAISEVPEPTSGFMAGIAVIGLSAFVRRRTVQARNR
jgi:hypothetical protein